MSISMSRYQWLLVALLSANFGVVFFDRNVFSYLASFIQADLHLSNFQIGNIASAFSYQRASNILILSLLGTTPAPAGRARAKTAPY